MMVILMGVSGSGKTTLGEKLSKVLKAPFYDGDDYHSSAAKEKMSRGIPLTDEDRVPWLEQLSAGMKKWDSENSVTVLACSALKQKYRDFLSREVPLCWVYLKGDRELIRRRLEGRQGHFVSSKLLDSQFEALEEPREAITVDIAQEADKLIQILILKLQSREGS
jgi:carbohydrate kinase (thermoresistant glucokinase family)